MNFSASFSTHTVHWKDRAKKVWVSGSFDSVRGAFYRWRGTCVGVFMFIDRRSSIIDHRASSLLSIKLASYFIYFIRITHIVECFVYIFLPVFLIWHVYVWFSGDIVYCIHLEMYQFGCMCIVCFQIFL